MSRLPALLDLPQFGRDRQTETVGQLQQSAAVS
jgi:hypothetical protein